jgi:hypothetical protein
MKSQRLLATALLAVVLLVGVLVGQDKPAVKVRVQLYPNWKKLGLTDDQRERIGKIQGEYRSKIADLEAQVKQLRKEERDKAMLVLTAAQKERLKELITGESKPDKKDK